jgi:methylthioribose-1-phosphate isomerase
MNIQGTAFRTIWLSTDGAAVEVIDQTRLPHAFVIRRIGTARAMAEAIADMVVRGAPLIGAAAAYGVWLAMRDDPSDAALDAVYAALLATRPTAVNLRWALDTVDAALTVLAPEHRGRAARMLADGIAEEDVSQNRALGDNGLPLLQAVAERKRDARTGGDDRGVVNVLTHCNAGWLATVDWGTALAPVYAAHDAGLPVHVWVDETRPRNQGAALTAWELGQHGVPHTVIADNAGGHLMQEGRVDLVLVGTDRVAANGDVANKIGTYLKALAAHDCGVPFYVAAPGPSIDWTLAAGVGAIPIEERAAAEVREVTGRTTAGDIRTVTILPADTPVANPAFDVTPARLVTAFITERGVATPAELPALYPEHDGQADEALAEG